MDSLEQYIATVTELSRTNRPDCADEIIAERCRTIAILWTLAEAGWVRKDALIRIVNLLCDPERWEAWKARGGDKL